VLRVGEIADAPAVQVGVYYGVQRMARLGESIEVLLLREMAGYEEDKFGWEVGERHYCVSELGIALVHAVVQHLEKIMRARLRIYLVHLYGRACSMDTDQPSPIRALCD
jgi:hypothetical protein